MGKLSEYHLNHIIELLTTNQELPLEYKYLLFPPEKQECELIYKNKASDEDIIGDTMALPLQAIKTFGEMIDNQLNNILIFGDNLQAMKTLLQMKRAGKLINPDGTSGIKLVYIDPPFATKQDFRGGSGDKAFQDRIAGAEFVEFIRRRLVFLKELLTEDGTIYVHLDSRKAHYIKVILDELFPNFDFSEIVWICGLMGSGKYYPKAHETIFCYKAKNAYFNPPKRLGYSTRITGALVKDENGWFYTRGQESSGGVNYLRTYISRNPNLTKEEAIEEANATRPQSAWSVWIGKDDLARKFNDYPVGTYAYTEQEKVGYPTQKPEALLDRIINASSREGDWVLDCFAGSGTALAVSEKLNRRWIGVDSGKLAIYTIQKRLLGLRDQIGNRGNRIKTKPFILYNAGLYDFSQLKKLEWSDWRWFALHLFQCRDEIHKISGISFDGYRNSDDVLVFNHTQYGGVTLDYGFIDDLHTQAGNKLSKKVFIIAPAASVSFLEDYIDKDDIRYYILRIPYSIINELHNKRFEAILQPMDESQVNETVEAIGFDFIRLPQVQCKYQYLGIEGIYTIKIETFLSKAMAKGATQKGNLEALSMVMIDFNFDGEIFSLDQVIFANELSKNNWEIRIPSGNIGKQIMIIYIDIYGNEYRELKARSDFNVQ